MTVIVMILCVLFAACLCILWHELNVQRQSVEQVRDVLEKSIELISDSTGKSTDMLANMAAELGKLSLRLDAAEKAIKDPYYAEYREAMADARKAEQAFNDGVAGILGYDLEAVLKAQKKDKGV